MASSPCILFWEPPSNVLSFARILCHSRQYDLLWSEPLQQYCKSKHLPSTPLLSRAAIEYMSSCTDIQNARTANELPYDIATNCIPCPYSSHATQTSLSPDASTWKYLDDLLQTREATLRAQRPWTSHSPLVSLPPIPSSFHFLIVLHIQNLFSLCLSSP